jgi:hypothetical protein
LDRRQLNRTVSFRFTRRAFLEAGLIASAGLGLPLRAFAWEQPEALAQAISESPLVYVSPLRSNGDESRCHAEVWFVADEGSLWVVTDSKRWRAAAIGLGLRTARLWVGDFGLWKKSKGRYRQAPGCVALARIDSDPAAHDNALQLFGKKYASAWESWGPRFKNGLASGERVLIRYAPTER